MASNAWRNTCDITATSGSSFCTPPTSPPRTTTPNVKDDAVGQQIKHRSQDARSLGVTRQDALRQQADDEGYIEPHIWTGIGRARSGCGSAIVGDPDQVVRQLQRYIDMGMRAFILSGYPHHDECELFARYVLPRLKTVKLAEAQGRIVPDPVTPLTTAERK
jgi:alkanesulfonate monooxygenase